MRGISQSLPVPLSLLTAPQLLVLCWRSIPLAGNLVSSQQGPCWPRGLSAGRCPAGKPKCGEGGFVGVTSFAFELTLTSSFWCQFLEIKVPYLSPVQWGQQHQPTPPETHRDVASSSAALAWKGGFLSPPVLLTLYFLSCAF